MENDEEDNAGGDGKPDQIDDREHNGKDKIVSPREQFDIEKIEYVAVPIPAELKIVKY